MRVSDLCLCEGGPVQVYGQTALPCPSLSCCSYRAGLTGKATRSGRERGMGNQRKHLREIHATAWRIADSRCETRDI